MLLQKPRFHTKTIGIGFETESLNRFGNAYDQILGSKMGKQSSKEDIESIKVGTAEASHISSSTVSPLSNVKPCTPDFISWFYNPLIDPKPTLKTFSQVISPNLQSILSWFSLRLISWIKSFYCVSYLHVPNPPILLRVYQSHVELPDWLETHLLVSY